MTTIQPKKVSQNAEWKSSIFFSKIFIFVIDLGSFSSLLQSALPKCVLELNVDGVTTAEHLMTINLIPAEILKLGRQERLIANQN